MKARKRRLTFLLEHSRSGDAASTSGSTAQGGEAGALQQRQAGEGAGEHHCGAVNSLAISTGLPSPEGSGSKRGNKQHLFTASRDATIKRWQVGAGDVPGGSKLEMTFEGHVDWVNDITVLEKENTLVSCSNDCTVRLWRANASPKTKGGKQGKKGEREKQADANSVDDYGLISTLYEHSDYIMCVAAAQEAKTFVSAGLRSEIKLWDLETTIRTSKLGLTKRRSSSSSSDSGNGSPSSVLREFDCASASDSSSCYSCDINPAGTVLACGSTDGIVRIWDTRSNERNEDGVLLPQMALRGHLGNIRCVRINRAGTMCVTGSSDKTMRVWDLGQQRCVRTFTFHKDSVWALDFDETRSQIISGGRDGQVFCTSVSGKVSTLLFEEEKSVLSLAAKPKPGNRSASGSEALESVWSASNSSSVRYWDLTQQAAWEGDEGERAPGSAGGSRGGSFRERRQSSSFVASNSPFSIKHSSFNKNTRKEAPVIPLQRTPSLTIVGVPSIIKHEILNNRQKILTEDTAGTICLWNVLTGSVEKCFKPEEIAAVIKAKEEETGEVEGEAGGGQGKPSQGQDAAMEDGQGSAGKKKDDRFERFFARINPEVTVSSWFSADKRLGKLSIHMEPKQCFSAEVYAVDLGIQEVSDELKFNMGEQVACSLFAKWQDGYKALTKAQDASPQQRKPAGSAQASAESPNSASSSPGGGKVTVNVQGQQPGRGGDGRGTKAKAKGGKLAEWPFYFYNNPCIITTTYNGEWFRKRVEDMDGSETADDIPEWVVSCVGESQLPTGLDLKFSFHLAPHDDSDLPSLQQGKLLAPRILLISKILTYVANKLSDQNVEIVHHGGSNGASAGNGSSANGGDADAAKQTGVAAEDIELLCNGKVLTPEMSLAKVRQSVWKRSDDIIIHYRVQN